ncbi:MAG TPA: DUF222 domain-containing protein, partial [Jatrophihabitans sp.]
MEALLDGQASSAHAMLSAAVAGYLQPIATGSLTQLSDTAVLAELRELEMLRRTLAVADQALIAEIDRRGLAGRLVMPSTSAVLQGILRLSPHEAKQRVEAA